MKIYEYYKKHGNIINLFLILLLAGYTLLEKKSNIEKFSANTIDFSALKNLGDIATALNGTGTATFPGNLVVKGSITSEEEIGAPKLSLGATVASAITVEDKHLGMLTGTQPILLYNNGPHGRRQLLHVHDNAHAAVNPSAVPGNSSYKMVPAAAEITMF